MARIDRLRQPPRSKSPEFNRWNRDIVSAFNEIPNISIISTSDGPNSVITGEVGDIVVEVGDSSSSTVFWGKTSGSQTTSGWEEFAMGGLSTDKGYARASMLTFSVNPNLFPGNDMVWTNVESDGAILETSVGSRGVHVLQDGVYAITWGVRLDFDGSEHTGRFTGRLDGDSDKFAFFAGTIDIVTESISTLFDHNWYGWSHHLTALNAGDEVFPGRINWQPIENSTLTIAGFEGHLLVWQVS